MITTILIGLATLIIYTRLSTGWSSGSRILVDGDKTVGRVPHWLPFLGHLPEILLFPDSFEAYCRAFHSRCIFLLNFFGLHHTVIGEHDLSDRLLSQSANASRPVDVGMILLTRVFGFSRSDQKSQDTSAAFHDDLLACTRYYTNDAGLDALLTSLTSTLKATAHDLVSFCESPVDQSQWERRSAIHLTTSATGGKVVEADMLSLITNYVNLSSAPTVIGSDFVRLFPNVWADIAMIHDRLALLATGLARWFPYPPLTRARLAVARIISALTTYEHELLKLDNGRETSSEWHDLDSISPLARSRHEIYNKNSLNASARAACDAEMLFHDSASTPPIYWLLLHIYADPSLLSNIRSETKQYVSLSSPSPDFAYQESIQITHIDTSSLVSAEKCPLLFSTFLEVQRMYTAPWSSRYIPQDLLLVDRFRSSTKGYMIQGGTYAHVAHGLCQMDGMRYKAPSVFKADRFLSTEQGFDGADEKDILRASVADLGAIDPLGDPARPGQSYTQHKVLMYTASILSLWDMSPAAPDGSHASDKKWKIPDAKGVVGTKMPCGPTLRVQIRRRETLTRR